MCLVEKVLFWPNFPWGCGFFFEFDLTEFEVNIMHERCALITKFLALGILFLSAPLGVKPAIYCRAVLSKLEARCRLSFLSRNYFVVALAYDSGPQPTVNLDAAS